MRYIITIFCFLVLTNCFHSNAYCNQLDDLIEGSFEDTNKTMYIIDLIFSSNKEQKLKKISAPNFISSNRFKLIYRYASQYKINMNYRIEECNQEFIVNENEKNVIRIVFKKGVGDKYWLIKDAYKIKNGQIENYKNYGFYPNSINRNFQDFLGALNSNSIYNYTGLSKYGNLNVKDVQFLKSNKINLSKNSKLFVKNLIIFDNNNRIIDIIYVTLKYFSIGSKDGDSYKGGYLLIDSGSMSDFVTKNPSESNLYLLYLLNKLELLNLKINNPNNIHFTPDIRQSRRHAQELTTPRTQENLSLGRIIKLQSNNICGSDVRELQERLYNLGYDITVDSCYGVQSYRAIQNFQRQKQIEPDGIVGPETFRLLFSN